jgi:hypothetical protein
MEIDWQTGPTTGRSDHTAGRPATRPADRAPRPVGPAAWPGKSAHTRANTGVNRGDVQYVGTVHPVPRPVNRATGRMHRRPGRLDRVPGRPFSRIDVQADSCCCFLLLLLLLVRRGVYQNNFFKGGSSGSIPL